MKFVMMLISLVLCSFWNYSDGCHELNRIGPHSTSEEKNRAGLEGHVSEEVLNCVYGSLSNTHIRKRSVPMIVGSEEVWCQNNPALCDAVKNCQRIYGR